MKQSTTQDQAYLKECLAYHEGRAKEIEGINDECFAYHRKQVKWYKAKLQGYFRIPVLTQIQSIPAEPDPHLAEANPYTKPTPIKDFFRRALNRIRGV